MLDLGDGLRVNCLALVRLLWRSPVMLLVSVTPPGSYPEENFAAASLKLDEEKLVTLVG